MTKMETEPEGFDITCKFQAIWPAFLLRGEGRCWLHTCRVRAHQQGPEINHLIFMGGAGGGAGVSPRLGRTAQLLRGVLGLDELPHRCCVCESTAEDIVTSVCVLSWAPATGPPPLGRRSYQLRGFGRFSKEEFCSARTVEVIKPVTAQY